MISGVAAAHHGLRGTSRRSKRSVRLFSGRGQDEACGATGTARTRARGARGGGNDSVNIHPWTAGPVAGWPGAERSAFKRLALGPGHEAEINHFGSISAGGRGPEGGISRISTTAACPLRFAGGGLHLLCLFYGTNFGRGVACRCTRVAARPSMGQFRIYFAALPARLIEDGGGRHMRRAGRYILMVEPAPKRAYAHHRVPRSDPSTVGSARHG